MRHPTSSRPFRRIASIFCLVLAWLLTSAGALAGDKQPVATGKPAQAGSFEFVLNLMPKAFQASPELEMTVITEMTNAGRKVQRPTAENPAYYEAQPVKLREEGESSIGSKPTDEKQLQEMMRSSLKKSHYLPTELPGHPPSLLLLYQWGIHGMVFRDENSSLEIQYLLERAQTLGGSSLADDVRYELENNQEARLWWIQTDVYERQNLLSRAALVGGSRFARELRQALEQCDAVRESPSSVSESTLRFPENGNPLHQFIQKNPRTAYLFDQATYDVYFVVATAYSYAAVANGDYTPLWRTKMTVNTRGVSMAETIPELVKISAPYFGVEMTDAATLTKQLNRGARVDIGPLQVVGPESQPSSNTSP